MKDNKILFREQYLMAAEKYAADTAYTDPSVGKSYTYEEFDRYVRQTARLLRDKGLKKGDSCVIVMPHNIHYVAVMYACLLSGIIYVPLSDTYPQERIDTISADAEAKLVMRPGLMENAGTLEPLDSFPEMSADDLSVITYTSGSTGKPKGVMHNYAGFTNSQDIYSGMMGFEKTDIYGSNVPFYFVVHFMDVYAAFLHGTQTVMVPDELRGDPKGLAAFIDKEKITMTLITPKVLRYFEKQGDSLRRVSTAGERVTNTYKDNFEIINGYGTSEAVCNVLGFKIDRAYDNTPIGFPLGDRGVYILDADGKLADEGELCVSGYTAVGYKNLPELTERTFTPNPFYKKDGHKILVHTGDLVKRLSSGAILYVNRRDWMIKINGQRVEPGEIEAAIAKMDGIRENCVKAFERADGQTMIVGYYVSNDGQEISSGRFAEELKKTLPSYMIPTYFVRLDAMPVNANGKMDRKSLAPPVIETYTASYAAPETDEQRIVCDAFAKLFGMERVGINDDFFSLGGDSIKTLVLQNRLDEYGITKADIFSAHTPKELALLMSAEKKSTVTLSQFAKNCDMSGTVYPLTESQLAVYLDSFDPDRATTYNNLAGLFLPNEGNPADAYERLTAAAKKVLNMYPILKCRTEVIDGEPSFVYDESVTIEVGEIETQETDRDKLARSFIRPFDLEKAPLIRAAVFRTPDGLFLAIDAHHVLCDGTSVSVMIDNISRAYGGKELRAEKVTNLCLAKYCREHLADAKEAGNEYFRNMLDNMESETELYGDDEPIIADMKGKLSLCERLLLDLDGNIRLRFCDAIRQYGVTESSVFASAFAYMLRLLSGQKKVLFFAGENGRDDPMLADTFGMMVHNIPMLFDIADKVGCRDYMKAVQDRVFECVAHDSADISALLSEYHIHPDYSFVYQGDMLSGTTMDGRYIPLEFCRADDAMNKLTLHVLKQPGDDYMLRFEYDAGVYTADTVERMAKLFARIVYGLINDEKLSDISLLTAEDIAEEETNNATEREYEITDIVSLFRAQVKKTPDRPAVMFKDETLTYAQVDDISERIAAKIRSLGIGKGDVVSVLIPRCTYMTTASLGALKSGAAYQPLDPSYPTERLTFMMRDAAAKLLIADESLLSKVPEYRGEVLLTKDIPALPACEMISDHPDPSDLFILLYTSGSTGTPKGVMLEHRNLANFVAWYREFYHLDESSIVTAYASYGFDANMMDQYPALTTGACVCIIEDEIRLDLLALEARINEKGITHAFMTTQVGRQFYSMTNTEKLGYLSTGGEKLVPLPPKADGPAFCNLYGPTECTILTTAKLVDRLYDRVPIGKPLNNYKCYVIDENGRRLPPLVPGELLIAGRGVARGYLGRPDLTEKAFIKNPFCDKPGFERAYRSGDIVRLLPNGEIDFIGRNDGQVKVRGFRIELTEVEGVIREFPGIKDATVQAFEDESSGEKFIAAYVVSDEIVDISALNSFILDRKPPYMVPAVTMQIESIPLNQNQKVNKRELPKPKRQKAETIPPQNDVQQKIFDCIAEVVGHTDFGITTNIYEAGLSSIGAIKLNVLLSKAFDAAVSSRDLKENNTIDKLETFLAGAKSETFGVQSEYGLTKTQEGIYVECISKPENTVYNIPILLEISGDIDTAKLKTAIVAAVNAHPLLKTRLFLNDDGDVRMRRMDGDMSFDETCIPERDISSIDEEKAKLVKPFRLLGGRLFRAEILHGEKTWLFIEMHHIVSDGSSVVVFLNDISAAYEGMTPETERYSGYEVVLNEEKLRAGDAYKNAKAYYEKLLDGAETQSLPASDITGRTEPVTRNYERFSADLEVEELKAWCDKNKASMNGLFSAAFGFTLNKYLGTESAVFAGIYSGRNDSRLANTVAMLVKTFPIAVNTGAGKTTAELAREVSEQLVDSQSSDIYSFAEICRNHNINADVMFAWQGDEFMIDTLCGRPAKFETLTLSEAKAPLNMNVYIVDGKLKFVTEYRADRFSEEYIKGFTSALEATLAGMTSSEWLAGVSLMYRDARRLLDSFNATDVKIPYTTCNRLFEAQVKRVPDKTAVIAGGISLTYTQLNESANRIANALIAQGTCPDDMVGVMMPREVWAYAVREGVLKAGGAYMPLAPDYPDDRVEYIIMNSGSKTLVTNDATAAARKELFSRLGVNVCTVEELLKNENTADPDPDITPDNLCYCIYTSGSTGKPKGVMIEHHSLVNFVDHNPVNLQSCEFVDNMTVSLALAALTFDVSVLEETLGLYHGGTVAMATEEEINNPLLLCEMMRKNGVDVMKCTPSYMNNLLDFKETWDVLAQMKAIDIGAEAFPAPLYDKMRAAGITAKIHNGYGPTETTITASMDLLTDNRITIGKPLCNTRIVMLDKSGNELPPDVPGELTIVGECVGRGYVANEKLTAEKFITWKGAPAYRSGDMARWGRNGKINFIGRADNQVKLRGLRIELDEIENVMNTYPSVLRSVVLVKTSDKGEQFLCAWFTASEAVDHAELKAHLAKSLAKYMIPSVFVQLDAIPLTQNGKVDKKALPEPGLTKTGEIKQASSELQKQIAAMFAKALGVETVGVDEDFFEIGGTSLLASKVAMQAMVAGLPIAYQDVFAFPTVEALERKINGSTAAAGAEEKPTEKQFPTAEDDKEIPEIKPALAYNTMEHVREVKTEPLGDILLTGATGFLGIHMLRELLESEKGKITCLIRRGSSETARKRLESMLVYYFDTNFGAEFDSGRLKAIDGDITDRELVLAQDGISFGTVINCAACVKHFAKDDILDRVNVRGVENLIALCEKTGSRLIQISTVSVAGENVDHALPDTLEMREDMLYFGQDLSNQYVRSKFDAEKAVLSEVAAGRLKAKVIRVGNLMSRDSDGEFQVNSITSGFMRNLKGYAAIGAYPVSEMARPVEFSPIDLVAKAVRLLSGTPDKFTVFHAVNGHWIEMGDVIAAMNKAGITVDAVDEEAFSERMSEAMKDEKKNMLVSGLISYLSSDAETVRSYVPEDHTFTKNALYRLEYRWPLTDERYLVGAIESLISMDFFSGDED